jgi:GNAT superfamily N-acetyltransferase
VINQSYAIRPVRPEDVPAVVRMVHELAAFERAPHECDLTERQLDAALFGEGAGSARGGRGGAGTSGPAPALFGHVGVDPAGEPHGFALWFLNFSTWAGVHGIYLEDLYVSPAARGAKLGRDLMATLARICVDRGYARLNWSVLDWNPAREFYAAIGAEAVDEWVPYRLTGPALADLAGRAPAHVP